MRRTLVAVGLVAASLVLCRADLIACGDKSFLPGGIRDQRAGQKPASILIYGQPGSRLAAAARELHLQRTLTRAGHSLREATSPAQFDAELASGRFDVIIADVADTAAVQQRIGSMPSPPRIVAVAYKLTKAEAADAAKKERFLVKASDLEVTYLDTISNAVRSKV